MQGLEAFAGAHCGSLGQHCRSWTVNSPRARLRFERSYLLFAKRGPAAVVYSKRYVTISEWLCRASIGDHASADEPVLSETEEPETAPDETAVEDGPTCQVKFVLQKKCRFGQRFNVVGDHSLLGNWNPEAAIPMDWADGHIWSVKVDIPVGKQVEFKFVLSKKDGEIDWQPGPNRIFETVEGVSPLVVTELWDYEDSVTSEDLPQESEVLKEDTEPISPAELSAVADIAGLDEPAKKELVDKVESEIGEVNGQAPSSDSGSMESSKTASEVPFAETNFVAMAVETLIDGDNPA